VLSDDLNKLEKTLITSVILYAKDNFAFTWFKKLFKHNRPILFGSHAPKDDLWKSKSKMQLAEELHLY
jgi:hypothetical protein